MNEWDAFDRELADALTDLPPSDQTVTAVTPWRQAMDRILLGLCLTCFSFNILYLQYLLPAVGAAALYLGFRSLRRTNRWFRLGLVFAACKAIFLFIDILLDATPLSGQFSTVRGALGSALTFLLFLSLRQSLHLAAASLGRTPRGDPALWACGWYLTLVALALFRPQPGWPVFLLLVFVFCRIVKSLARVAAELEDWGYAVAAAPVKVSSKRWRAWYFGSLAALVLILTLCSNHRPLQAVPFEQAFDSPATASLRTELAELGFPETFSVRLLPEDLRLLEGAVRCDGGMDEGPLGSDQDNVHQNRAFAFLFPDGSVRVVRFFVPGDSGGLWRCRVTVRSNARLPAARCRLFFSIGKRAMAASPVFQAAACASGIDFFGTPYEEYSVSTAPFSFPAGARDRSGYVLFEAEQGANPMTALHEMLYYDDPQIPQYPLSAADGLPAWSVGDRYDYGNGSGLVFKADEAAAKN